MTAPLDARDSVGQPPLSDLMARYLARQTAAHASGLATVPGGEVEPYEAVPIQAVDPRSAWDGATAVLGHFGKIDGKAVKPPADWAALVAAQEPAAALPFAVGHFPQAVRDLLPLLRSASLAHLASAPAGRPVDGPGLEKCAETATRQGTPQALLLALGTLRLARQFDAADAFVATHGPQIPAAWKAAWDNEVAALLWQRGRHDQAARLWATLPESVPVLFNRGMATLFQDHPSEARGYLKPAVAGLPESSAWHHLGRLYLALAEMRV